MKKVSVKLYEFGELSEQVRKKHVEDNRFKVGYDVMECYSHDYKSTLEKFSELMGIEVYNWQVDYCGRYFNFRFKSDGPLMGDWNWKDYYADEISGKLLRRWLNNNFVSDLLEAKKYYSRKSGSKKVRRSRIQMQSWEDLPLTGMCYDFDILKPIFDVLAKPIPESFTLNDLVEECLYKFFDVWHKEYEYWCDTDSAIEEELENRYEGQLFFEDGTKFVGIYEEAA